MPEDFVLSSTTNTPEEIATASGITEEKKVVEPPKPDDDEDVTGPEGETADDKPKKKGGFQKRIDKLTREKADLEAEIQALRTPKKEVEPPKADEPPDPLFYESQADYIAALVKFETAKAKLEVKESLVTDAKKAEETKAQETQESAWVKQVELAHKNHPDLAELLEQDLPVSSAMNAVLLDSEIGGELLHYLASHPEECADLSKKNPIAAAKALGLIEDRLVKDAETKKEKPKAEVPVTRATKPITPVSGGKGSEGTKSPDDMNLEEYRRWRESQR